MHLPLQSGLKAFCGSIVLERLMAILFYFSGRPVYMPYSSANLCFTFLEDQSICHVLQPIFVLLFWKTSLSAMFFSQSLFYFSGRPVYLPYSSANLCFTFLEDQSICHILQPIFVLLFFLEDQSICHVLQSIRQVVTEDVLTLVCCILAV